MEDQEDKIHVCQAITEHAVHDVETARALSRFIGTRYGQLLDGPNGPETLSMTRVSQELASELIRRKTTPWDALHTFNVAVWSGDPDSIVHGHYVFYRLLYTWLWPANAMPVDQMSALQKAVIKYDKVAMIVRGLPDVPVPPTLRVQFEALKTVLVSTPNR